MSNFYSKIAYILIALSAICLLVYLIFYSQKLNFFADVENPSTPSVCHQTISGSITPALPQGVKANIILSDNKQTKAQTDIISNKFTLIYNGPLPTNNIWTLTVSPSSPDGVMANKQIQVSGLECQDQIENLNIDLASL